MALTLDFTLLWEGREGRALQFDARRLTSINLPGRYRVRPSQEEGKVSAIGR